MDELAEGSHILRGCDASQRAAITSLASPLLVVAGAGSGKTRVLARRIAWRTTNGDATAENTLALTFTRKAAGELRDRLDSLGLPSRVWAGTFHGIALAQLRQRALERDRPMPRVLESKSQILSTVLPNFANRRQTKAPIDRRDLLSGFAGEIEWAKARMISPERYAAEATLAGRTPIVDLGAIAEGYASYETERKKRRLYDFDDLLTTLAELITRDANFAASQRWKFRHLFVDEFQDANAAQLHLLDAWLGNRPDLFCVGDARQSIYGWNGADPSAMENFTTRYPGSSTLVLSTNYRSTQQLVRFAHAVLPKSTKIADAAREEGLLPTIASFGSDIDESISIAEQIRQHALRKGRYSDCAVLARTNAQLALIERALSACGIPYRQAAADQFLQRPTVRRALKMLHSEVDRRQSGTQNFRSWLADITLEPLTDEEEETESETSGKAAGSRPWENEDDNGDLATLISIAAEYCDLDPAPSPDGFQSHLEQSLRQEFVPQRHNAVDLLSFHRAKGLEWPVVFIVGLESGYVPISRAKTRSALAEEQRLLYVALSRASEEVHCSWAKVRTFGKKNLNREPSPYLESMAELLNELTEENRVDPVRAKRAFAEGRALLDREGQR
jgi:DNA helicase-2/ATP-dependent DNA helicase PcrA